MAEHSAGAAEAVPPETAWQGRGSAPSPIERVLVVEDSPAHRRLITSVLTRWGFEAVGVGTGHAALEAVGAGAFDLILSDWIMPGMSGLDLCRKIRALGGDRYVYFILLTAKSERAEVAEGLAAGADDFLSKPLNSGELRARIAAGERLLASQRALEERNGQLAGALAQLQEIYDRVALDLAEARRLQQSLVPRRALSFDGGDVSLLLRPCGQVGGDLVGCFAVREGKIGLYSIDVSGHGVASALMTARLASYFSEAARDRNIAITRADDGTPEIRRPLEICEELSRLMAAEADSDLYFTMAFAACDTRTGAVTIAQAGHPHPIVQDRDGAVRFEGAGGMPIGLVHPAQFGEFELKLAPGDRLILYSDGFVEQPGRDGAMFDEAGLAATTTALAGLGGEEFLEGLVWSLGQFAGGGEFADDLSGAMFEYRGVSPSDPPRPA